MAKVRIIGVPPGEAPPWVREKWVGLELPVLREGKSMQLRAVGVVTGPRTLIGQLWGRLRGRSRFANGYVVPAREAIEILAQASPEAANWWKTSTPFGREPGRMFLFQEEVCEIVAD